MTQPIRIDGSRGEGGGQVLRTSLSLAAALGRPVRVENVRAGRKKPGLLRQHLTALRAIEEITAAEVRGAELGSQTVELHPGQPRAGEYAFAVGSAGSTTLVLQTVLMPLALADGPSRVRIEGGTHNPWAPPFEFLTESFLPQLAAMGVGLEARLVRPGFHPAGGGVIEVDVTPVRTPRALELLERGPALARRAQVVLAQLPESVAERERETLCERLSLDADQVDIRRYDRESAGPGNAVQVSLAFEQVTEVSSAFGRRGLPAARVAKAAADAARRYLAGDVPVGEFLADQLLLPMALLGGGTFRTGSLSSHARTNLETLECFLPGSASIREQPDGTRVMVQARQSSNRPGGAGGPGGPGGSGAS